MKNEEHLKTQKVTNINQKKGGAGPGQGLALRSWAPSILIQLLHFLDFSNLLEFCIIVYNHFYPQIRMVSSERS